MSKDDEQFFYFLIFNLFDVILQNHKCVQLEDIAAEFKLRTQVFFIHPYASRCCNRYVSIGQWRWIEISLCFQAIDTLVLSVH